MGIRSKLLLPLLALGISFATIVHFYWLPQLYASEVVELQKRELATMEVAVAALIPSLLSGDLAQVHTTLNHLLERRSGWKAIHLKAADERYLYPIALSPSSRQDDTAQWLTLPVEFEQLRIEWLVFHGSKFSVMLPVKLQNLAQAEKFWMLK